MTSQRWSKLVSVFVFALVLGTAGSARAQWGFPGPWGYAPASQFGLGYGAVPGISPFGYGSFGAGGYVDSSNFIGFPMPGYAESSRASAAYDHVVSVGLQCRDLGPRLGRLDIRRLPPTPSATQCSSRGTSAVITVE